MNYILNAIKIEVYILYLGRIVCETLFYIVVKKKRKKGK